jgi:hypothetical protein
MACESTYLARRVICRVRAGAQAVLPLALLVSVSVGCDEGLDARGRGTGEEPGQPSSMDGAAAGEGNLGPPHADLPSGEPPGPGLDPLPVAPAAPEPGPTPATVSMAAPRFSIERGFYKEPFGITLSSATDGAQIRYTTDGSHPSETVGTLGTQLQVSKTTVVRAVAYSDNLGVSEVVTHTYLFVDDIIRQGENAGGSPDANTELGRKWASTAMVPKIVDRDPAAMKASLEALPALVLSGPDEDVFKAIATSSHFAAGTGVALELIYADRRPGFQVDCEARLAGQAGRMSQKKAITLAFKGRYGVKTLNFPLVPGSHVKRFDQLRLRSGWQVPTRPHLLPWGDDLQIAMSGDGQHGIFVHAYINGAYFGLYSLVEVAKGGFGEAHYGGDKDEWTTLRGHEALVRALAPEAGELSEAVRYEAFARRLDIQQYADLLLLYMYLNAPKLPAEPRVIANEARGIGHRIYVWDIEEGDTVPRGVDIDPVRPLDNEGNPKPSPHIDNELFDKLWVSSDFRIAFADRARRHLLDGGALTEGPAGDAYRARVEEARGGYLAEVARWSPLGGEEIVFDERLWPRQPNQQQFEGQAKSMLQDWMPRRAPKVLGYLRAGGLYPEIEAPRLSHYRGSVPAGTVLTMSGAGTLLYTLDGTDPRVAGSGAVHPQAIAAEDSVKLALDRTTHVKVRVRQRDSWSALTEAVLSVGPDLSKLQISELMYRPPRSLDGAASAPADPDDYEFIELHNAGDAPLDLSGVYFSDGVTYRFGTPTVLAGRGRIVLVRHPKRFAERYPNVAFHGAYAGALSNDGERVALRDPSGSMIASVSYDNAGLWPGRANGGGHSLVPLSTVADLDPDDPAGWRVSAAAGGSPGAGDPGSQETAVEPVQPPTGAQLVLAATVAFPQTNDRRWPNAVGYHFQPKTSGRVTHLGGNFMGDKQVKLFARESGELLASVSVRSDNQWRYEPLDAPIELKANRAYTLAVYLVGSGGSYRRLGKPFPRHVGDIRITSATYVSTSENPDARPTADPGAAYPFLLGQPDLAFVSDDRQ